MYTVLDKDTIEMEIIPHIPIGKTEISTNSTIGGDSYLFVLLKFVILVQNNIKTQRS